MSEIKIIHNPTEEQLSADGVKTWPIWQKEESEFPWHYDSEETCLLLEGAVEVTPAGGEPVLVKAGDLVTFPKGMDCTWKVLKAVRKHYRFADD
jgi:uncharacterized cupin superfamily protein